MKTRFATLPVARKEHVSANHAQSGTPAMQLTATMPDARANWSIQMLQLPLQQRLSSAKKSRTIQVYPIP